MNKQYFRPPRGRTVRAWFAAVAVFAGVGVSMAGQTQSGPYSLNWSTISAGGTAHMRTSCYILSGYIDFVSAPGILYASGPYTLYTGFWAAAPIFGQDQISFDGFEECK